MKKTKINRHLYTIYGSKMMNWAKDIFPYNRSITGEGVRSTLNYFKKFLPGLKINYVKTGYKAYDWIVPKEWKVNDAYISDLNGKKIVDFKKNNLHLIGYSHSIEKTMFYKDLDKKLVSDPNLKNAIPYRTSYYKKDWGFCISHNIRKKINKKKNIK